jgi:hypothetical protein
MHRVARWHRRILRGCLLLGDAAMMRHIVEGIIGAVLVTVFICFAAGVLLVLSITDIFRVRNAST